MTLWLSTSGTKTSDNKHPAVKLEGSVLCNGIQFRVNVLKNSNKGSSSNLLSRSVANRMFACYGSRGNEVCVPYFVKTVRRFPFLLMPKIKEELNRLEKAKVTEPTNWCSPITSFKDELHPAYAILLCKRCTSMISGMQF